MFRGTTPTLILKVPIDTSLISKVYITFKQKGRTRLEKELKDCTCEENQLVVPLTQADTLLLDASECELQLRTKLSTQQVFASKPKKISISDIFKDGEI